MGYKFNTNYYKYSFQYKWDGRREVREDDTAGNCSQLKRKVNEWINSRLLFHNK